MPSSVEHHADFSPHCCVRGRVLVDVGCERRICILFRQCGETKLGEEQFKKTVALDPNNVKVLCKYGCFLEELPNKESQV